ncbi:anaerobic glycerol-3-phosphate dehydrogenase subunit C [Propionicimonas sp.]|uniref:anaerobic glycerol-3-phosphate dehydrogenase subunit C n=1 Tax=Propionicimonas sp. TaxID=1955623 RepID=UPI00178D28EA|nr:anaerobic glycerol-3-phosphate dehydrogenase subunit C [Propionicimonas sp.]MBU3976358.1 anaerobic glycerol-3-phosphate dehydrogenase subunit C [Actinomycetota bacterium]MBA3022049.1 anaerobic glycerol-3-phosphate dehydrogenase subunit C [Propionicimonas sp.]MBU3987515.1 anaerobic glycerol-3-phosphate dehydrogenase subunit C [Actinomycetota bacterium]MBU4006540.1 anaerobic glycerol-3-phosphate dehydrogenase subunit C [Actinomycetota bacterium]MBU4065145.1 anaerobic glycerol-3-phosphate dehy
MNSEGLEFAGHALSRASLDSCVKCTICETQCPVAAVTPLFTGPKFVGPQAERFRDGESVDHSLDYCSSCGICTLVCPQGVQIAELNSQARAVMKADHMPLRDRLIGQTVLMGTLMTPVAPLARAVLNNKPLRKVMEVVVGVHADAPMPPPQSQTFESWFAKRATPAGPFPRGAVVFFHGCAGGYFEVETSKKSVEVLERLGFEVLVPKQGCCGLAQQSNGLFKQASASVLKLCDDLRSAGKDLTIISSSGSCTGMLKHEASEIMGVEDERLRDVGTRTRDIMEFLLDLHEAGELPTDFAPVEMTVPYHAPCQLKSQGIGKPALEVLRLIPGLTVVDSNATCCGIAGTYGLKKEKYEVAQAVGKPLFDMVKATSSELALCDTETCRWQIEQSSGVKTEHPIWMIHKAYGLS